MHRSTKLTKLYIDVETFWNLGSTNDIKEFGATKCLSHESAGVNCIAWAIDDGPISVQLYNDCIHRGVVYQILESVFKRDPQIQLIAHNASFEAAVFKHIYGVELAPHLWNDTMARCLYYGYPPGLDDAAKALGCSKLKDVQSKATMKKLASGRYKPNDSPDLFNRLYSYCANDVAVMREIDKRLADLPPNVQKQWQIDQEINQIGVPIDVKAVNNAVWLKEEILKQNNLRMQQLTDGYVQTVNQTEKIVEWVNANSRPFPCKLLDCTADSVANALSSPIISPWAKSVLELRQEAGLSSLAKYQKIANYEVKGRLHQMHFWYGAHTGRPTGSGPQVLNLPRTEHAEEYASLLSENPKWYLHLSKPAEKLKEALRGVICASSNNMLVGMDLAQAEARNAGWLAGDELSMKLFQTSDPYCTYGRLMFDREITKKNDPDERNAAKASVLANGFAGGIGAGQRVAQNYGIDFDIMANVILPTASPMEMWEAERNYKYYIDKRPIKPLDKRQGCAVDVSKQRFRKAFARITAYWDELERAFLYGGQAGPLNIEINGNDRIMTLPSGRQLFYRDVEILPNGKYSYMGWEDGRWQRISIWKGTLIENACQAVAQDLASFYRDLAHKNIGKVVHHCYDEFTMEVDKKNVNIVMQYLRALTATKPDWAATLSVGFDYWEGVRYGK